MLGVSNTVFDSHSSRGLQSVHIKEGFAEVLRSDETWLAMQDAKRAMAKDPALNHIDDVELCDSDFSVRLYFRRDAWDQFELQALSRDLMPDRKIRAINENHYF